MALNSDGFPITKRRPPKRADVIQLYSLATPNGVKTSVTLEELDAPYDNRISIPDSEDRTTPELLIFQMGSVGPALGQRGVFHRYKGAEIEEARPAVARCLYIPQQPD